MSTTALTGSSCCLVAARRQADSVDAVLPTVTALDVVAGQDPSTVGLLRPPAGYMDDIGGAVEKTDKDGGVFYTTNSQHPDACGHVSDLLASTSWACEYDISRPSAIYDRPADNLTPTHIGDGDSQQFSFSDEASTANSRTQPTLLVDFHC